MYVFFIILSLSSKMASRLTIGRISISMRKRSWGVLVRMKGMFMGASST